MATIIKCSSGLHGAANWSLHIPSRAITSQGTLGKVETIQTMPIFAFLKT